MNSSLLNQDKILGGGSWVQRIRLTTGLILMGYAFLHFTNHSLGLISIEQMQAASDWNSLIWQSWPGTIALYGSLLIHGGLGFWKFINLKTWRLPIWEWLQVLFGLAIPFWLASHITYTRFAERELGIEVDYYQELPLIWSGATLQQNALLLIVWIHGCIGLHFWLRLKPWYQRHTAIPAAIACLVPTLAIAGWVTAARWLEDLAFAAQTASGIDPQTAPLTEEQQDAIDMRNYVLDALGSWEAWFKMIVLAIALGGLIWMLMRAIIALTRPVVNVTYGDNTKVTTQPGTTLLDVSRANGIAHMSVCGGRARCSTCRTLVIEGHENLTPPTQAELELLNRLKSDGAVRLACQAQAVGDVEIRPLIQPQGSQSALAGNDPLGWGVEREVAIMFLDIRGFSKISEQSLPYDTVFILNSFFEQITAEIEKANGYVDKFMGDGVMAIFGLSSSPEKACLDALEAAAGAGQASIRASRILTQHLPTPLKIGIGLHFGNAVIGRIGKTRDQVGPSRLTAVGDTVNISARLEAATKEYDRGLVVSKALLDGARKIEPGRIGPLIDTSLFHSITVRNIKTPIKIAPIALDTLQDRLVSETA